MNFVDVALDTAHDFCTSLFSSYGFNEKESALISDVLLAADRAGIESHGLHRLVRYDYEITSGCVEVCAKPQIVFETPISAVLDAQKAMGQLACVSAMQMAISKAKKNGFGIVTVRNSNHIGINGYYAELAAAEGLIGICMTNSEAITVPTFGSKGMLGTNAFAFAMDAEPSMLSVDFSTSVVPRGAIEIYAKNKKPLPKGWAVDKQGLSESNAATLIENIINKTGGGILPLGGAGTLLGGHKGFGIALIVEVFCGILSGGLTSNHINLIPGNTGICNCCAALNPELFGDRNTIREALSRFLEELRQCPHNNSEMRVRTPGERKAELKQRKTIPVSIKTIEELRGIAAARNVSFIF
ncbi:MAG: Ldh family oxidoreductase [Spirochaetaceae bacterium]|jgi:LDH2 family malate/lactate/ureidoglycolate dehydrogenase|nr:Ldh family oxidoreductase [Spirochaetaceae bacterium]